MSNFVKLTHARYVPGKVPGFDGTYEAGDPVYIEPDTVLAVYPGDGYTTLLIGGREGEKHHTHISVMESTEAVYTALKGE